MCAERVGSHFFASHSIQQTKNGKKQLHRFTMKQITIILYNYKKKPHLRKKWQKTIINHYSNGEIKYWEKIPKKKPKKDEKKSTVIRNIANLEVF